MVSSDNINDLVDLAVSVGGVVASGVLYYGAIKSWSKFIATSRAISKISQVEQVPISGLRELLSSKSNESGSQSSNEMLVLVSGVFKAYSGNYSKCDAKSASLEQTGGSLSHEERKLSTNNPFILSESGQEDSSHVRVCLEGWDKLEKMNAVGVCSLRDGEPQIKACNTLPFFLTKLTRDEMVERLKGSRRAYFWLTHALVMVSITVLLKYTIINVLRLWKKWKHFLNKRRPATDGD